MTLRFEEWLVDQQDREDSVGDLARVLGPQVGRHEFPGRKGDEHKNWADIVIKITQPGYIASFNEAWREFLLEKEAAKKLLDQPGQGHGSSPR